MLPTGVCLLQGGGNDSVDQGRGGASASGRHVAHGTDARGGFDRIRAPGRPRAVHVWCVQSRACSNVSDESLASHCRSGNARSSQQAVHNGPDPGRRSEVRHRGGVGPLKSAAEAEDERPRTFVGHVCKSNNFSHASQLRIQGFAVLKRLEQTSTLEVCQSASVSVNATSTTFVSLGPGLHNCAACQNEMFTGRIGPTPFTESLTRFVQTVLASRAARVSGSMEKFTRT
jgi:hypothetical protein